MSTNQDMIAGDQWMLVPVPEHAPLIKTFIIHVQEGLSS
jgi:hypothetical protein